MDKLTLIKVGGKIVEEPDTLAVLLQDFASIDGYKVLVHGGGRMGLRHGHEVFHIRKVGKIQVVGACNAVAAVAVSCDFAFEGNDVS